MDYARFNYVRSQKMVTALFPRVETMTNGNKWGYSYFEDTKTEAQEGVLNKN
jgi:hypothetical protein